MHNLRKLVISLALTTLALGAPGVSQGSHGGTQVTINLAGRPISGIAVDTQEDPIEINGTACIGIAYANVNGKLALLTASHCMGSTPAEKEAKVGQQVMVKQHLIGEWGATNNNIDKHDLAYIKLYDAGGHWPSNLNRVYRGDVFGDDYWTITVSSPPAAIKCSEVPNLDNLWVWQNYQYDWDADEPYRAGDISDGYYTPLDNGHCTVKTSIPWHGSCCIDSGSPFIIEGYENTVFAIASGKYGGNNELYVTPLYKGLSNLDEFWQTHGQNIGAWLCYNATCGGIGGF